MEQGLHPVWNKLDGILVINLDTSTDRMERFRELNALTLPMPKVQRQSAVMGRMLPTYGQTPWFTPQTGERAKFWGGTGGCALSHRRAIEHAKSQGWRNVLILEDDAVVREDSACMEILCRALDELNGDYMLYLGFNKPVPYGRRVLKGHGVDVWQVEGVLATHGYILPASMYDRVLALLPTEENVWEWLTRYRAIDSMYRDYMSAQPGVRIYALYPVLVDQGAAVSDIGGGAAGDAEYSCNRPPFSYASLSGALHLISYPLRRLKVRLNSMRTYRRGQRSGLPGFRKRRKK